MYNLKQENVELTETENIMMFARAGGGRKGERMVKGYKPAVIR